MDWPLASYVPYSFPVSLTTGSNGASSCVLLPLSLNCHFNDHITVLFQVPYTLSSFTPDPAPPVQASWSLVQYILGQELRVQSRAINWQPSTSANTYEADSYSFTQNCSSHPSTRLTPVRAIASCGFSASRKSTEEHHSTSKAPPPSQWHAVNAVTPVEAHYQVILRSCG